mmetsp:Transcript_22082/g.26521  ORF Transcript_22082/g.26521 Transcript_22082/m.26521 type:complete len:276 (-) Transcript_22082:672-1499(-)|eukprot:CAMPEP_0197848132 /NCGR_PEP_ID=MMETSP1438-20131217/7942_1 /TAXON_ID=1461541 /ORGANISM="Pterosperma sp., Strain CCMP1384" /LENGTH=275 /DNA_ID=CAMNT_0043460271 /DNA_START=224 /DNA_END=1051 /DNA_ORIENTATION=-
MAVAIGACVGAKRGLFDGDDAFSPPSSKRVRHLRSPHRRFSSPGGNSDQSARLTQLRILFPEMELQVLSDTLEASGNNIDSAIKRLEELRLGTAVISEDATNGTQTGPTGETSSTHQQESPVDAGTGSQENSTPVVNESQNLLWADAVVQEMSSAANIEDARARAVNVLQKFEAAVTQKVAQAAEQATTDLKTHLQNISRDNTILKRAVAIQNSRQQEYANKDLELEQLREAVVQYREQLRTAEMNNYALAVHLRQAMGGGGVHVGDNGHPPDVC